MDQNYLWHGGASIATCSGSSLQNFMRLQKNTAQIPRKVFRHFQDAECGAMKTKLIGMGDGGIGRVPFAEFYKTSIEGDTFEVWKFELVQNN